MKPSKVILITGATGGIGKAISHRFAREGCRLLLHYHQNEEAALSLQRQLEERYSCESILCRADLSVANGVEDLLAQLPYRPHVLVHNAGAAQYGLFHDVADEEYARLVQLHLTSPFRLTQQLLSTMLREQWGRIIFITSIWAETGAAGEAVYALTKGGATSLMKALAKELGPSGITVNAVAPGVIETRMNDHLSSEERRDLTEQIPLGRWGTPEEVAHAVHFFAQEESAYITGQVLHVNGGWLTS